jgi:hypothetical protein
MVHHIMPNLGTAETAMVALVMRTELATFKSGKSLEKAHLCRKAGRHLPEDQLVISNYSPRLHYHA